MSEKKILIDAAYPEEIRVAVVLNNKLSSFQYQSDKKLTKGNIYLAKVSRVEPSLQAVFVDYVGDTKRHGFLPFSEIHPDYYQLPASDREELIAELNSYKESRSSNDEISDENVESSAQENRDDEFSHRPEFYKKYKIQEVIKKDQIILVQVEKEERGNKGAALTTYISLAGRYCVFMPNATKGGGISKKITDSEDRERLKALVSNLSASAKSGAVIIRTAACSVKKDKIIEEDFRSLKNLWDDICGYVVKSEAPKFIHEEGDLIKKTIRDGCDNDVSELIIQGNAAYEIAKSFMKLIAPKQLSKLKLHEGKTSLFHTHRIEEQIAALYSNEVPLESGGSLVITQTEALVSIDVNSGRSTKERNVENTAFRTNLEAAREIARQLKLRDLSGLVVIDFIDMEDSKNRSLVERELRDALSSDKARIQVGKIGSFGLLELSRQRLKQSFLESYTVQCQHCMGRGRVRRSGATAISILRAMFDEISKLEAYEELTVSASSKMIEYLFNEKRKEIVNLDSMAKGRIKFSSDEEAGPDGFFFEKRKKHNSQENLDSPLSNIDATAPSEEIKAEERVYTQNKKQSKFKIKRRNNNSENLDSDQRSSEQSEMMQEDITEEAKDDMLEFSENNISFNPSKKRNNFNKKKKRFNETRSADDVSSDESKPFNKPNKKEHRPKDNTTEDANFEQEMAVRRKQNQSLLKEIWKKIVD